MIISALPRLRAIADFANQIWQPMVNAAKFPLRSSNYQPVPLASEAHFVARCHWSQRIGDGCVIDADRPFGHLALHFLVGGCKAQTGQRSYERRVGKECVSTCRFRWWPFHYKKQTTITTYVA